MMRYYKKILYYLLMIGIMSYVVVGCTKGKLEELPIVLTKTVEINVTLPTGAPIDINSSSIYLSGKSYRPDAEGIVRVEVPINQVFDLSLMLPPREGETEPTVYLSSMLIPGEVHVDLNASEAAVALLLEGIDQRFFQESATSLLIKDMIREEGADFVNYFITEIEKDPYLMHTDNLRDFLLANSSYIDSLTHINTILFNTFDNNASSMIPSVQRSIAAASVVDDGTSYADNSVKVQPSMKQDGFLLYVNHDSKGYYTGDLTLWNASFLPSLYRMTDTTTKEVLKEIPKGTLEIAFSRDMFAPYGCPFNIQLPNYTMIKSGSNNVQLEVYTPGFKDFDYGVYTEEGSPSTALLMRSAYSYAFIPILSIVLPGESWSADIFDILQKAGVFEDLVHYWSSGDISGGLRQMYGKYDGLPKAILYKLVEDPKTILAILAKKVTAAEVSIASAALAIKQLQLGLQDTSSKIIYYATFPLGVKDIKPPAAIKIDRSVPLPKFTLRGHGFSPFTFQERLYSPTLEIKVYDVDDKEVYAFTLESDELEISSDGREIIFELPRYVVQKDTKLSYAEVRLNHAYVDIGFLGSYFDYFNELKSIILPLTSDQQRSMRIYLTSELIVREVDKDTYTTDMEMLITGEGFHSQSSGLPNKVYFLDDNNHSTLATISKSWENKITLKTPKYLDLEYMSIGKSSVYVALEDGSRSNLYPVIFVPDAPTADVYDDTGKPSVLYKGQQVTLKQEDSVAIYYSINGSPDRPYVAPLTITESSHVFAYAEYDDGQTRYRSPLAEFKYETCDEGETYIDYPHGPKCEIIRNAELMVLRYCPLRSIDYHGPFEVNALSETPMEVSCSYYYGFSSLQYENHIISVFHPDTGTRSRVLIASTLYWQEPRGRPMTVSYQNGKYYEFCPNGSFYPEVGSCEKD